MKGGRMKMERDNKGRFKKGYEPWNKQKELPEIEKPKLKVVRKQFSAMFTPILWGRSSLAWLTLTAGIINLIFVFKFPLTYFSCFSAAVFGICFMLWIENGIELSLFRLIDKSIKMNNEMIEDLRNSFLMMNYYKLQSERRNKYGKKNIRNK
jgi:hypothetical protein